MSARFASVLLLACCLCAPPARAEIYRWTDSAGREHFTTKIEDVPAAQRGEAMQRAASARKRVGTVESAKPQAPTAPPAEASPRFGVPAARDAAGAPGDGPRIGGYDEAGWRDRVAKLRGDIERLEGAVEDCKGSAGVRWNPGAGRRAYAEEVREAEACGRSNSDLDYARMQLDKLVETARKQGVPPGWVR